MSISSDDEVIPPSPTSAPVRSQKRLLARLSRRRSNASHIASIVKDVASNINAILSQRDGTESQVMFVPYEDPPTPEPSQGQAEQGVKEFNETVLESIYDSPEREEVPVAEEDQFAWMEPPRREIKPTRVKDRNPSTALPDFASLSQIASNQGVAGNTQQRFEEYLNENVDVFRDVPSQGLKWEKSSSPVRKKLKLDAPNSPEILRGETENLLESSDDEMPEDLNKTVQMPVDEEDDLGVSPVIKDNIDVLSKSFEGEECTQKSTSEGRTSRLQMKQHFVDVQLVRRSFSDVSQTGTTEKCKPEEKATDFHSSPTCSKKFAAPKRLFREAFQPPGEPSNAPQFGGFMMANMKKVNISEETLKRVQHVFADLGGCAPLGGDVPGFQTVSLRREPAEEEKTDPDSEQGFLSTAMFEDMFTQNLLEAIEKPADQIQLLDITEDVRLAREASAKLQEEAIAAKPKTYSEVFKSEMIVKKMAPNRQKLRQLVSESLPRKSPEEELHTMSWETSLEVEFDVKCDEKQVPIDHFVVVPNLKSKVGFCELSRAFRASRGVNPHLIPEGWLENAWRFVVTKLAALEASFPAHFAKEALTPRNVLNQLHYRYHREISLGNKPCLRKITELEEPSQKTIVLYVVDIRSEMFLVVSDGWYKIPARLDRALEERVRRGKIEIGSKLIAQGCKLFNCDSEHSPLEVPANVFLELHGNATRRCRWDTKLGFHPQSQPQCIRLDSVLHNGGLIPQLRVRVVRVYPAVYVEMTRERKKPTVRSEKAEKRHCARLSKCFDSNFENIYNEEQEKLFAKQQCQHSISIRNITNISSIRDPEQLNNILNNSYDPESVENEMTGTQKDLVRAHVTKMHEMKYQEITDSVRKRLKQQRVIRRVRRLMQIRVVDAKRPAKSCVINFWTQLEEITSLFREGDVYEFTNCNAREIRNGDIFIDGPSTEEGDGNIRKLDGSLFPIASLYVRHITPFSDLPTRERPEFTEFDVVGVVVEIQSMQDNRKFEQVFLADAQKNIIRVTFWKGLGNFALEDVVTVGAVLCFSNLQWRPSNTLPQLAASETTVITVNPKSRTHQAALEQVQQTLCALNMEEFIEDCRRDIPWTPRVASPEYQSLELFDI